MRVVVVGGTGFIGSAVVRRLLAATDHRVVVASRRPHAPGATGPTSRIEMQTVFAGDLLSMARAFAGADAVVYAVQFPGHPVEQPSRGWTYLDVDGRGTPAAVEAARRAGVGRFVYLSGAGAGRGRGEPWFRAKDMAEAALLRSGIEHVSLRPSWVYGPGDRSLSRFIAFCRTLPVVPVIGDGTAPVWPSHVDDLAACVVAALGDPDVHALALDVGGPERLTMNDVVRAIQDALGRHRPILHHPIPLMRWVARATMLLPRPILSPGTIDFLTQTVEIDPAPAARRLGVRFRSLREALPELVRA